MPMQVQKKLSKEALVKQLRKAIKGGKVTGISGTRVGKLRKTQVCRALGIKNTTCHKKSVLKNTRSVLRKRAVRAGKKASGSRVALCKRLGMPVLSMSKLMAMAKRRGLKVKVGMKQFELIAMLRRAGAKSMKKACNARVSKVSRPRVAKKSKARKTRKGKKVARKH